MNEQFGAIIGIDTSNSERNINNLVTALNNAAKSLFNVENIIKKYADSSNILSSSFKNMERDFKGIIDVNGKLISSLNQNSAINNKIIADNNTILNTTKMVQKEFDTLGNTINSKVVTAYNNASIAAKQYATDSTNISKTLSNIRSEKVNVGITNADNIVTNYSKASKAVDTYNKTQSNLSKTLSIVTQENANLGLNIAGNIVGNYQKANKAVNIYDTSNTKLAKTLNGVLTENTKLGLNIANDVVNNYTRANDASKKYDASSTKLAQTLNAISRENTNLGLNIAGNVVTNYAKANKSVQSYNTNNTKLASTLTSVIAENEKLGLNIAGNIVGSYAKANKAATQYSIQNTNLAKTIRDVAKENNNVALEAGNIVGAFKRSAIEAYNNRKAAAAMIGTYKQLNVNILENEAAFRKLKKATGIEAAFISAKNAAGNFFRSLNFGHAIIRTISYAIIDLGRRFISWALNVHNIASEFLGFRNAIQVASGSLKEANDQMQYAISIARKYKIDVAETTKAYSKFANAVSLAGIPLKEANEEFRILAQVGRVLNISSVNMRGLFLAIEQMASKGFVSLEELRRQLGEHLPGAVSIAAKAWGNFIGRTITVGEFMDMVSKRAVETTKFLKPFTAELDKMTRPLVEQSLRKSSAAFADLKSSVELLAATIGTTLQPVFVGLANSINFLVKTFAKLWPAADHLKQTIQNQIDIFERADAGTGQYKESIAALENQLGKLKDPIEEVTETTETFAEKAMGMGIGLLGVTSAAGGTVSIVKTFASVVKKYIIAPLTLAGTKILQFGKMLKVFNVYTLAISAFLGAVAIFPTAMKKLAMAMYGTEESTESVIKSQKSLEQQLAYTGMNANSSANDIENYRNEIEKLKNLTPGEQSFTVLNLQKDIINKRIEDLERLKIAYQESERQAITNYEEGGTKAKQYGAAIESINALLDNQKERLQDIGKQQDWLKSKYTGLGLTAEDKDSITKMGKEFGKLNDKIASFGHNSNEAAVKFWILKNGIKTTNKEVKAFADALINRGKMLDDLKLADQMQRKIDEMKAKMMENGDATNYAAMQAFILKNNIDDTRTAATALKPKLLAIAKALDNRKLIKHMDDEMKKFNQTTDQMGRHTHENLAKAFIEINKIQIGVGKVGKKAELFIEAAKLEDEKEAVKKLTAEINKLNGKTEEYNNRTYEAKIQTFLLNNGFKAGADKVGMLVKELQNIAKTKDSETLIKTFTDKINEMNSAITSFGNENNFAAAKALLLGNGITLTDNEIKKMSNSLAGLNLKLSNFYVGTNEAAMQNLILKQGIDMNTGAGSAMAKQYLELAKVIDNKQLFLSAAENTAKTIEGAFSDFLFDPFEKGVKGMVQSINDALARMAADILAHQAMKQISGFIDNIFSASFNAAMGGGGTVAPVTELSTYAAGGRAVGGPVKSDTPYWVGETGKRELFIPQSDGYVIPENKIAKNNSTNNTYNVSINLPGVQNVSDFEANQTQIINRLTAAISEKNRRR